MEPRPRNDERRRRKQALLVMAAAALAATALSGQAVHAFVVPASSRLPLPRTAARARGELWASTTQESEPQQQQQQQQEEAGEGSLASLSSSSSSSAGDAAARAAAGKGFGAAPRAKTGTVNKRLLKVIDAELKTAQDNNKGPEPPANAEDDTDLNGINPIQPLGAAMFAGFVSFLFWRITIGLATALNNVQLETDWYPVQRMFSVASTAFVGITALGAGVIGVTAVGLLGLAGRVTVGIATGELDMNKKKAASPTPPVPLDAQGLPKITGAWYDVPKQQKTPPQQQPEEKAQK